VIGILQDLYLNLILLGPELDDRQLSAARRSGVVSKLKCLVFLARGENVIASRDTFRLSEFRLTVDNRRLYFKTLNGLAGNWSVGNCLVEYKSCGAPCRVPNCR